MLGWLKVVILARRRLRELGKSYDLGRERWRADKLEWKRDIARANVKVQAAERWVWWNKEQVARVEELEAEIQRIRAINGKLEAKYHRALEDRDRALGQRNGSV